MSTIIIIFLVLSFIAGIMSRSSPTIEITEKNKHLFNDTYSELNKIELKNHIIKISNNKQYAYNNSKKIVSLCQKYFHLYSWDITILEIIITNLSIDKEFHEALRYCDVLCTTDLSYKWGLFFKGEVCYYMGSVYEGSRMFFLSVNNHGMEKDFVKARKKELLHIIKAKTERDMRELEAEKIGEGTFKL